MRGWARPSGSAASGAGHSESYVQAGGGRNAPRLAHQPRVRLFRIKPLALAGADGLAERPALEEAPAAGTGGRQDAGLDEEGAHQGGPEEHVGDDEGGAHVRSIGRWRQSVYPSFAKIGHVSWLYIALLALAVAVFAGAEWPRLGARLEHHVGADARRRRERARRKASFRVIEPTSDADDFAASVERDLANLPTTEDEYRR